MSDFKVWRIVPLSMVTTSEQERDKWVAAGHDVVEFVSIDSIKELESQLAEANRKAIGFLQCLMTIKDDKPSLMTNQDGHEMFCYYFNPTKRAREAIDAAIKESEK